MSQSLKIAFIVDQENMTEESIDTDRMMLGIDAYPEITWINCADEMPPDTESYIIMKLLTHPVTQVVKGNQVNISHSKIIPESWQWTPYTPEKWKELNK